MKISKTIKKKMKLLKKQTSYVEKEFGMIKRKIRTILGKYCALTDKLPVNSIEYSTVQDEIDGLDYLLGDDC